MLELNNIEVIYSDVILVLKGLSLTVKEGQIVALLGSNGAGKSTTLKAISGLLKPENGAVTDGEIRFLGQPIHKKDAASIVRTGIFQVMEGRRVFEHLTIDENLRAGAYTQRHAVLHEDLPCGGDRALLCLLEHVWRVWLDTRIESLHARVGLPQSCVRRASRP
ncbi:ATP-binding cassette domain-containing protein [Oscillochloris sp. ZM17-4]|uniref:ATP-binding cassette domain-containing protein n=1 Tax=Oscillochloris sp. ZM17-4 TaxID=2866714 RepID=UPI00210733E1|nr:ATP-binding cassette domain-containing protein [Oscillochloris sp. ZM17-4]